MKKQIFIAAFGLVGLFGYSQGNSDPWPVTGNVGIGTGTGAPAYKLEVSGGTTQGAGTKDQAFFGARSGITPNWTGLVIQLKKDSGFTPKFTNRIMSLEATVAKSYIDFDALATTNTTRGAISFGYNNIEMMRVNQDGKVRIGNGANDIKTAGIYKLFVEDGILTEKVKVAIKTTTDWADYVFQPDYELMPLADVEVYTQENGHLPNVPSAEEMITDGLDVAKMDAKLLEKIEELTLYAIDQDKQIDSLEVKLAKQEQEMTEMKAQLKALMEQKQ